MSLAGHEGRARPFLAPNSAQHLMRHAGHRTAHLCKARGGSAEEILDLVSPRVLSTYSEGAAQANSPAGLPQMVSFVAALATGRAG
jgi:hypothetical protein